MTPNTLRQSLTRVALIIMGLTLIWRVGQFLFNAKLAILYPFELDYGEGIVWQQAVMLVDGRGYGDITRYPFIVFHYPPVYHLLAVATAKLTGLDQLMAGRLLSTVATLVAAVFAGLIARRLTILRSGSAQHGWVSGLATVGIVLSFTPIHAWAPLMRVDMVGLAFALGGVLFAIRALERPSSIYIAALLFVLAVYSRQTLISAPAACFGVMLLYDRKTAVKGIATSVAIGTVALAYLTISTHGMFVDHILSYNVNRYTLRRLMLLVRLLESLFLYIMLALVSITASIVVIRRHARFAGSRMLMLQNSRPQVVSLLIIVLYFFFSSLTLLFVGKSGSALNYLVEWSAVCAILVGLAVPGWNSAPIANDAALADRLKRYGFLVPLAVTLQIFVAPAWSYAVQIARPPSIAARYRLLDSVRHMQKPILSDDMVLIMQAGKQVPYESAIFAELSSQGRWDSRLITQMIEQHRFGMIFTYTVFFDDRYPPAVAAAINKAYPRKIKFGQFVIHAPARH